MQSPTIEMFPVPPQGESGWPWRMTPKPLPNKAPNGQSWPKISIVTPSYNQGHFLEETIRSVLLQGYPNLEYIIIDGGSTDNSIEIIRKYESWLTHWVSENDHGQSHALNKGFKLASGKILAWLNSDDLYLYDTLYSVAQSFIERPNTDLVIGKCDKLNKSGVIEPFFPHYDTRNFEIAIRAYATWDHFSQPSIFFKETVYKTVGPLDEKLHYTMDLDYWLRTFRMGFTAANVNKTLSIYREHDDSKSVAMKDLMAKETFRVLKVQCGNPFEKGWWARWRDIKKNESGYFVRNSLDAFKKGDIKRGFCFMICSFTWPPEALRNWIWVRLGHWIGPKRRTKKILNRFRF
ncbi:glycosyltransferase family 2 protein [Thermodesulfobacteriota bacterium]